MINHLSLSGVVSQSPVRKMSPNGILHCQFYLEHVSKQNEANLERKAWCKIPVIISGQDELLINSIKKGSKILVNGFINMHNKRNSIKQLILHASEVKFLN